MNFLRSLALAIALAGLTAALGNRVLAVQGPFWIGSKAQQAQSAPAPIPAPSNCGAEAPPIAAANAGFSTCAANFDFTQSTGSKWLTPYTFGGGMATIANWLDCADNDTTKAWHYTDSTTSCDATHFAVGTDPTYGGQVLDIVSGSGTKTIMHGNVGSFNGDATPGFPAGFYLETTVRFDNQSGGYASVFTWQPFITASANAWQDSEFFGSSGTNADASTGCGYTGSTPNCGNYGGLFWDTAGQTCFQRPTPCPVTGVPGYTDTAYHVYGMLVTINNTNTGYSACSFIDNVFQSCVAGNYHGAGNYTQPNYNIVQSGPGATNQYIKNIRWWTCAWPTTSQCPGTTLIGGPAPLTLAYYR